LAVCGSHGKTTTAAWLGYVLWRGGLAPNVLVGSRVPQFSGSILKGKSKYFVAEVDEYQNKLQYFKPRGVILNNIDFDHPDFFKNQAAYTEVFAAFLKKIPPAGFLVMNNQDPEIKKIKKYCPGKIISYGFNAADYRATDIRLAGTKQIFKVLQSNKMLGEFRINLSGEHNILNALAVIATAKKLGLKTNVIKKHLAGFKGTERRGQILGKYHNALIIDDYAHHPTEIKATLKGLCAQYKNKKIITVFHPHTYTRTKALFKDFVASFCLADELVILDIYDSARESASQRKGGVSSQELVQAIKKYNQTHKIIQLVKNIKTIPQATTYLKKRLKTDDLLLLMGAGDVFRVGQNLLM
jgi:UDP-N-acetylmuramate--alanine ligase